MRAAAALGLCVRRRGAPAAAVRRVRYSGSNRMENYGAVLHGPNDLRVEKLPVPTINEYEVLIKVACVGICGSDLKMFSTGRCGLEVISEPVVMGHEGAGTVVQVGAKVSGLRAGDRVAIEPTQPCRACELCRAGRYNLCAAPRYCSTAGAPGNLVNYYKHVADFCHKIPDNVSMEEAAAVQPLAIAIHACSRARVRLGSNLAIFGAGPIGVLCAMTARAMGADKILMTDVVESRLEKARELGADYTLLVKGLTDEQVVDQVLERLGGRPNISIDACGHASAQRAALTVTRTGGTVLVVGIGEESERLPLTGALLREVDVIGAYRLLNSYGAALAAVARGGIALARFVSHRVPLRRARDALALAASGQAMKVIIQLDADDTQPPQ